MTPRRRILFGQGLSAEAKAWEANIKNNGGTIPAATLKIFDDYFFKPAKANGNILTEADRLNIWCGLNGYEIAARTNTINSSHFVTPVSSPTFDNNGYKSSGTSYLNLNYNPNSSTKLTQNSSTVGYIVDSPTYAALIRGIGSSDANNLLVSETVGANRVFNNSGGGSNSSTTASGIVLLGTQRINSANQRTIVNGTLESFAVASTGRPNLSMFELTHNNGGSPAGNYDTKYHRASFCGSGNLDVINLRLILLNLFTALGL